MSEINGIYKKLTGMGLSLEARERYIKVRPKSLITPERSHLIMANHAGLMSLLSDFKGLSPKQAEFMNELEIMFTDDFCH